MKKLIIPVLVVALTAGVAWSLPDDIGQDETVLSWRTKIAAMVDWLQSNMASPDGTVDPAMSIDNDGEITFNGDVEVNGTLTTNLADGSRANVYSCNGAGNYTPSAGEFSTYCEGGELKEAFDGVEYSREVTISTSQPSGGSHGAVWYVVSP